MAAGFKFYMLVSESVIVALHWNSPAPLNQIRALWEISQLSGTSKMSGRHTSDL